jgi:hypothetical protein
MADFGSGSRLAAGFHIDLLIDGWWSTNRRDFRPTTTLSIAQLMRRSLHRGLQTSAIAGLGRKMPLVEGY